MSDRYILDAQLEPQPSADLLEWARWIEGHAAAMVVAQTHFTLAAHAPARGEAAEPLPEMLQELLELHEMASRFLHGAPDGPIVFVSTRFLGLDQRLLPIAGAAPLLYETRVFGGPLHGEQDRYTTRAEAVAGHEAMCARLRPFVAAPS